MPTDAAYMPTIKELPYSERPRERLLEYGVGALSTAELLAIILRTGARDENVILLSQRILARFGNLAGMVQASSAEMIAEHGLGPAKVAQLKAALEDGLDPAQVRVLRAPCMGRCDTAPVLEIGHNHIDHATPEKVEAAIAAVRRRRPAHRARWMTSSSEPRYAGRGSHRQPPLAG